MVEKCKIELVWGGEGKKEEEWIAYINNHIDIFDVE